MKSLAPLFLASFASLTAGCSANKPVTMADSFDLDLFGPHVDDLHTPYVAGASFQISVNSTAAQAGWSIASSNPKVIAVATPLAGGSAGVTAVGPGEASLTVLDASGKVVDSHPVSVAIPDRVTLSAEGLLLTGSSDSAAEVSQASIVAGGEATFLVRYFALGAELYGSGALQTTATNGITTTTQAETFATARDFLLVTAPPDGTSGSVSLLVSNVVVGQVPVTAVSASAVTQVGILSQSAAGVAQGASLTLYAHAVDATAAEVYGASFDWSLTGGGQDGGEVGQSVVQQGPADLFLYAYDSSVSETVTASYDGFSPSTVVHGRGGSVGSTAATDCSVGRAPGSGPTSFVAIAGLVLAGGAFARRRRSARRAR